MVSSPPPIVETLFTTILVVALHRFSEDADILPDLVPVQEQRASVDPGTALGYLRRLLRGMLYADDVCIASRSSRGLKLTIAILFRVFSTFSLTVSEKKPEIMNVPTSHMPAATRVQHFGTTVPPDHLVHLQRHRH